MSRLRSSFARIGSLAGVAGLAGLTLASAVSLAGCSSKPKETPSTNTVPVPDSGANTNSNPKLRDDTTTALTHDAGAPATKDVQTIMLGALFMETPIMSDMEWKKRDEDKKPGEKDKVFRIGYLRKGAKVAALPEAHKKPNCTEGWYELRDGGFVCLKYATLDMNHPSLRQAPHQPDMNAALPYEYGYNMANGTPLYRSIPSHDERVKLEPWLAVRARPKPRHVATAATGNEDDSDDGGTPAQVAQMRGASASTVTDPLGAGLDSSDAGATPWYLREYDGGKPQVTLDDLKGEGPIVRRMVKGFFLALDKSFSSDTSKSKWWRTTGGLLAPYDRIYVHKMPTEFHGMWLIDQSGQPTAMPAASAGTNGQTPSAIGAAIADAGLAAVDAGAAAAIAIADAGAAATAHTSDQVGFVESTKAHQWKVSDDHKNAVQGADAPRFTTARLTGQSVTLAGAKYLETEEGWWMRERDGTVSNPGPAPTDLAPNEKWIDVNLKNQTLVAFQGTQPVYATLISSGKMSADKEKDHKTPTGSWRIREKHIAATMDGDVASDGPYSIEDVPWIMYFNGSYALHGAFWHADFGHVHSHGCVNLSPWDARALFGWTEPRVPEGWHGVMATPEDPGTRVVVHD